MKIAIRAFSMLNENNISRDIMNHKKISKKIVIFIIFSVVFAGILEILVRQYIYNPNRSYIRTPGWQMTVRTNDLLPFATGDHKITINRYGYRGALPTTNAKPMIAVTGGSTVEDWVFSEPETWTEQLQSQLRNCLPSIEVINLGKAGANARHNLMQLEAASKYLPRIDTFIVLLGLNDFLFDLRIRHPIELPADWWDQQAFMTRAGEDGPIAVITLLRRAYDRWLSRNSTENLVSDFGQYQQSLIAAYRKVRAAQWVDEMPDLSEHLATYRTTIKKLKGFADKREAEIVFVSQPYLWSKKMSDQAKAQIYAGFIGSDMNNPATTWYTPKALEGGLGFI